MDVSIRLEAADDASAFHGLQLVLDRETRFMLLEPGERELELPRCSYRVVATDSGLLVGYVQVAVLPYARARHKGHVVMGVRTSHSGQGVGRALLEAAILQARERGMRRLELTTMTHNRRALGLYLSCGFQVEGLRRAALEIDGADIDEYYMGLLL